MKIKCEYCNNYIDDSEEKCPGCGSPNRYYNRVGNQVPTTIEELEKWYKDHNLPPYETTRFFIGINYTEPKAFGIYKDESTGKFIVYKNKDNGKRAIRYNGPDEAYAVNDLYQKLKERIALYKKDPNHDPVDIYRKPRNNPLDRITPGMVGIFILVFGTVCMILYLLMGIKAGYPSNSGGSGSSYRYESDYDNDSDYSYSDYDSDSGYDDSGDWSSDW